MTWAAMYVGDHQFRLGEATAAEFGLSSVQIEVAYTGICGTDLHIYEGDMDARVGPPAVIGHEMVGRVASVGAEVTGISPGDIVTARPIRSCGQCVACLAGLGHICQRLAFLGIDAPGSMQELWTVPAETVVPLPRDIRLTDAALIEPTAVAVHDVARANIVEGEKVVVVGGGPVGLLIALVARSRGAEVIVVEPDSERREFAQTLGLLALDPDKIDVAAWVETWTLGSGAEVSFEVSGSIGGVATAVGVLGVRGRVCLVAIHTVPREIDLHAFFWKELSLVGARLYGREEFVRAAELVGTGVLPVGAVVSSIVPISDVADAFALLKSGGQMKVLIDCTDRSAA